MDNKKWTGLVLSRFISSSLVITSVPISNELVKVNSARYYNKHSLKSNVLTQ